MSGQKSKDKEGAFRTMGLITLLYGFIFFIVIAVGYFLLFGGSFVGLLLGVVLAIIAISIAKLIGSEPNGIRGNMPLFVFLLLISAVGVFNTLMLNFEGRTFFTEAIKSAKGQVDQLEQRYRQGTPAAILVVEKRIAEIESKQAQLVEEILNRNNCGQGPAAMLILDDLQRLLPGFRSLSIRAGDPCRNSAELVSGYSVTIPAAYRATEWFKQAQYDKWLTDRETLVGDDGFFPTAQKTLIELQNMTNASLGPRLVSSVKPRLEEFDLKYRETYNLVQQYVPDLNVPSELDLLSVRSVGEWSQLVNLVFDNLHKPTTYVYPTLAVFADWLMIYLFAQLRARRTRLARGSNNDNSASAGILR